MTGGAKPVYAVPTLAETSELPWNGYSVVSTFSGCGGSSLGYKMAGYRVIWANEFVPAAAETYRANFPDTTLDASDIRTLTPKDLLSAIGMKPGELDLFDGSPPCASFSMSGKRERGWGKVKEYSDTCQRVDDLFFEYARLVKGVQPRVFVAENVSGLVKGTAKGYFLEILAALKGCGYRVESRLLDAQWLGVPQARQRIIFIGVRNDLGLKPRFPKPLPYRYSLRDALPWVTRAVHDTSGAFSSGEFTDKPSPAITVGVGSLNSCHYRIEGPDPETDISPYAIGREWDRLAVGQKSDKYLNLIKVHPDRPCNTVTATGNVGTASVAHPYEKRKFTIPELKRICGFPDDFILTGSYTQQWERLGRAVPPVMMRHIAQAILPLLEEARC